MLTRRARRSAGGKLQACDGPDYLKQLHGKFQDAGIRHGMSLTAVLRRSRSPSSAANCAYAERCGAAMQSLHIHQMLAVIKHTIMLL